MQNLGGQTKSIMVFSEVAYRQRAPKARFPRAEGTILCCEIMGLGGLVTRKTGLAISCRLFVSKNAVMLIEVHNVVVF